MHEFHVCVPVYVFSMHVGAHLFRKGEFSFVSLEKVILPDLDLFFTSFRVTIIVAISLPGERSFALFRRAYMISLIVFLFFFIFDSQYYRVRVSLCV